MNSTSSRSTTPFPPNLPALTSVRFLLALGVVLFHYHLMWIYDDSATGLLERAYLGVDVFFILSGFILTHVYREQIEAGRYRHGAFLAARFARVYPMHIAMLLLMLRYEIRREFAPYIGVSYDRKFGKTADYARALGEDRAATSFVMGIRAWF